MLITRVFRAATVACTAESRSEKGMFEMLLDTLERAAVVFASCSRVVFIADCSCW